MDADLPANIASTEILQVHTDACGLGLVELVTGKGVQAIFGIRDEIDLIWFDSVR